MEVVVGIGKFLKSRVSKEIKYRPSPLKSYLLLILEETGHSTNVTQVTACIIKTSNIFHGSRGEN
jgi:hypothetical protein